MRTPAISLGQLAALPVVYRAVIPPAYEDRNGPMNMRCYLALYDEAGDAVYPMLELTADYFAASGSAKLLHLHYLMLMEDETRSVLSSMFECMHAHADLNARRTAPFPAQVAAKIDAFIAAHCALVWPAPFSGSMGIEMIK